MAAKISGISVVKLDEHERVIPKNSRTRVAWWRVTLGKKITGTKKLRRHFAKESEAKEYIERSLETKVQEGNEAFSLPHALRIEARQCQELLGAAAAKAGRSLTLTEAVGYFLRHALPQGGTRTFGEASKEFISNRTAKNLKVRYLTNLKSQFRKLDEEFSSKRVNAITAQMLESWISKQDWSPKTRNNYVVTLRTFFAFCVRQRWCAENPADGLEKSIADDAVTGILTVTESARVLEAASDQTDVLSLIAIQLFAGLRRSEVCALDWEDYRGNLIEVTAAKAKTRSRRVVDVQPALAAWLAPLRQVKGPIFKHGEDHYNKRLREVFEAANEVGREQNPPWPEITRSHNCLRHTCASMHLAHFANESYTALQMGHSTAMLHKHYKGLVSAEDAGKFWHLGPEESEPSKVAALPGACS